MRRDPSAMPTRLSARELGLATLLFSALTLVFAYPISIHPSSLRVDMGPDGDLGWWVLSWDAHAFLHRPWAIFDANIFYPDRYTLAYGENIIGLAFFAAPIIWLTGDPPLATTLISLMSVVLCGLGAYVLARRVGLSVAAAVVAGVVFACAPPRFFRIGQITLTSIQWIPFALASAHAYLDGGRPRDLRWTAGFVSLQVLASGHGAVFVTLSLLMFGLYRLALGEPVRLRRRIRDLGLTGTLLLSPSVLIFYPYYQVQRAGLRRGLGSWDTDWVSFFASPAHLYRALYEWVGASRLLDAEVTLFPGLLAIVLAILAFVWRPSAPPGRGVRATGSRAERTAAGAELTALFAGALWAVFTVGGAFGVRMGSIWLDQPSAARAASGLLVAGMLVAAVSRRLSGSREARTDRALASVAGIMLLVTGLGMVRPTLGAGTGLLGEYFDTADFSGPPAFTALDRTFSEPGMARRWGGLLPPRFSARWVGYLAITRAGKYSFTTTSDDGSQLFIDGNPTPVVDNGGAHSAATRTGTVGLSRGSHKVELRYSQEGGDAALEWAWSRDGSTGSSVPGWALSQAPASLRRVAVVRVLDWLYTLLALAGVLAAAIAFRAWSAGPSRSVAAAWAAAHRRDGLLFYALLTLVTLGLAFGPPYGLWQYVYWVPGFNFIRASSRFTLVALLGVSVLAGFGVDAVATRWRVHRTGWLAAVLSLILVAEYAAFPMGYARTRYEIPAVDRWLDGRPKPFVIAEVPVHSEQDQVDYMNHASAHWQKTVQGYHGWRPAFHYKLNAIMERFPDETSLDRLATMGVDYVVMHQERYSPEEWRRVEAGLQQFESRLRLEHVDGSGRVYAIVRTRGGPSD